jgi:predicted DNA-binding transcriptional regulator AlpA
MPEQTPSILVSQPEASRLLGGVSRATLWRMTKRGDLQRITIGSRSLITRDSIERLVINDPFPCYAQREALNGKGQGHAST